MAPMNDHPNTSAWPQCDPDPIDELIDLMDDRFKVMRAWSRTENEEYCALCGQWWSEEHRESKRHKTSRGGVMDSIAEVARWFPELLSGLPRHSAMSPPSH